MTGDAAWPPPGASFETVPVLESELAFIDAGVGTTVLFLHWPGNWDSGRKSGVKYLLSYPGSRCPAR